MWSKIEARAHFSFFHAEIRPKIGNIPGSIFITGKVWNVMWVAIHRRGELYQPDPDRRL
jgi:hypothetical protein